MSLAQGWDDDGRGLSFPGEEAGVERGEGGGDVLGQLLSGAIC